MNKLPNDLIPLGKVIKPHGIRGQIKFKPYNQDSSLLKKDMVVWLKEENNNSLSFKFFKIISISYNSLHPIIKLDQINDRNKAIELRDYIIYVPRSLFPNIKNNDIYFVDLIGCKFYNKNEEFIGIAKDIAHFPGDNHIVIIQLESKEFMIPIKADLIKFFDIEKKYVMIDIADGLVDN